MLSQRLALVLILVQRSLWTLKQGYWETPSAVVLVATLRALKYHGQDGTLSDMAALKGGGYRI